MSTVIERKTPIEAKWNLAKVQEMSAQLAAHHFLAAMEAMSKSPELLKEFDKNVIKNKIEYYKSQGVKTPLELAKHQAELEANVFGSKISIQGDEHKAILTYDSCACFKAMQKTGKMTKECEDKMGSKFNEKIEALATAFGFKGSVKFEGETAIITYSK